MNSSDPSRSAGPSHASEDSSSIEEKAREFAHDVKRKTADAATRARDKSVEIASEKKAEAADRIERHGTAAHQAAEAFAGEDPNIAWVTHRAADRLQGIATYLRNRDFRSLREDGEQLARRHPAAFLGGMFVAGLLAGSFLKAGRSHEAKVSDNEFEPAMPPPETGDLGAPPDVLGEETLSPGSAGFHQP